ncbi:16S rRNA (guanine527-N7)-methyltransferase [Isorropodon fossajaponicum endosymbiont JTNG4]|uniref:16S rRNA (guanine(527)-N(7))-methyltransferase RsmG n=1 Tax=Isorropodon fossajaponicum symbiont TaxID=883811 RepID=UPI001915FB0A|nr:16S rRNA (guanine(527)-N(7))-methyltransferase RsmG [Isorropodon fossajaponicum symbiont]BBB23664.1 16S rRNA (guanine527-N7)-methyltransferase [Isorropodon fossajaponicum endosymbiont JTNG4]
MSSEALLIEGASLMGIKLESEQISKLMNYLELIIKWNKTYNLSAIRTIEQGVYKHLLDSLSVITYIKDKPLLDVGSGAGLPGIVISIMRPELSVTVLDTVGKKCCFMQFVKTQLQLKNLNVINNRVETYQVEFRFGQIISRAFSEVEKILKLTQHLLCDNGEYLLMKAASFQQETLPYGINIQPLCVPGVLGRRYLLILRREK